MKSIKNNLTEVSTLSLSSISEVESGKTFSSNVFKAAITDRMKIFNETYQLVPGHCVILLNNNSIEFFVDFLALYFLGITSIPLDTNLHNDDIERVIDFAKPALVISHENIVTKFKDLQKDLMDIALILFTSGTTGTPKGVLVSKEALNLKMEVLNRQIPASDMTSSLCFLPTFFGHGLICNSLFPIFYGKHFFIAKKMSIEFASDFSDFLTNNKINFFSSVPSHWELILEFSSEKTSTSLKRVHCASAPLKKDKAKKIINWLGNSSFYDIYGATEMLGWFGSRKLQNTIIDECQFSDFWEIEYKYSDEKELLVKSKYMFKGYWKQEESTIDGYFNTGDLFDNSKLIGRSKNIINKNGIKINTDELNSAFLKSGFLIEAASFPIEDNFKGEDIGVFIILKENSKIEDFKTYCRDNLSANHYPAKILVVDKIPTNSRNKTSLSLLKSAFRDMHDKR
ncbi:MAG: acyl--CoA ligase [Rhizobacter sp.]|nr:acyl--CoA ligase [Bacteriovorax sp.]